MNTQVLAFFTCFAALLIFGGTLAHAQDERPETTEIRERLQKLNESDSALKRIVEDRLVTEQRARELEKEITALKADRAGITNALIQAAKTERQLSNDVLELEGRIDDLETRETGLRESLNERRGLLAEVLAALQRMGLNPPPAILVTPDDALSSVRSSILLGAVVPEMRAQTQILLDDLNELSDVRQSLQDERSRLQIASNAQSEEQARLQLLLDEKRALEGRTLDRLAAEQKRAAQLAAETENLEALIARLQTEIEAERKAAKEARLAAEQARLRAEAEAIRKQREAEQARLNEERERKLAEAAAARQRAAALARAEEREAARPSLSPGMPFAQLTRQLVRPAAGRTITAFGDDDGLGTVSNGETLETRIGAIVTTPADAEVLYAGPFRAYGQLLILDAGDGYHVVLAGMSSLDVTPGQRLLAGEPVGVMGNVKLASVSAAAIQNDNPKLYIEFRKNGKPVDPSPWWEETTAGRT